MQLNKRDMRRLQERFVKLRSIDKSVLSIEIEKAALNIQRNMKRIAPVDTGNLRNNIKTNVNNKVAEIRSDAPYSGYVEFGNGSPRTPGTIIPFFYPTVNSGIRKLIISLDIAIKKLLK